MSLLRGAVVLVLLAFLGGCMTNARTVASLRGDMDRTATATSISNLPFFPQDDFQCGPAALATVLRASGVPVVPDDLVPLVYVPELKGSFQIELLAAARSFERLVYQVPGTLEALLAEVDAGHPVLVLQNLGLAIYPQWHYAVVKGYDLEQGRLILNSGTRENYALALRTFERTWNRSDNWGIVVLEPGDLPASGEAESYFQAVASLLALDEQNAADAAIAGGLERWPDHRGLRMSLGNQLYARGQLHMAAAAFAQVLRHDPDYAPAYNNLAHVQSELGLYQAALANINRALVQEPEAAGAYRQTQARVLDLLGR